MRYLLTILIIASMLNSSFACLSASQHRLFPLGQTSQGLCVVETHLNRSEYRMPDGSMIDAEPAWRGITYFKIYNKDHREVYSEVIDSLHIFKEIYYDSIIGSTFDKGLALVKAYPDFEVAQPVSIAFCDYQQRCSLATLQFDSLHNQVMVLLPNNSYDVNVLFDSASIASNLLGYYGNFTEDVLTANDFSKILYLNSVRQFQVGDEILKVIHIGAGQTFDYSEDAPAFKKEYALEREFTELRRSVFEEPVLHHGHGFDYFIWE